MKKIISLLLTTLLLSSCSLLDIEGNPTSEPYNPFSESYTFDIDNKNVSPDGSYNRNYTLFQGETFQINYSLKVEKYRVDEGQNYSTRTIIETIDYTEEAKGHIEWKASKEGIVSITDDVISVIGNGRVIVYGLYKDKDRVLHSPELYFECYIPVTEEPTFVEEIEMTLDETYKLDMSFSPINAYRDISSSGLNIADGVITPTKIGTFNINISYYIKNENEPVEGIKYYKYIPEYKTISVKVVGESRNPYFMFKGGKAVYGEIKVPMNKYKTLDIKEQGITAYNYNGEDITDTVSITGEYDLSKKDNYTVTCDVTAPNGNTASFTLAILVYEYDIEKINKSLTIDDIFEYKTKFTTNKEQGKESFTKVTFEVTFTKKEYDFLEGYLYIDFYVKASVTKPYRGGTLTEPIEKTDSRNSMFDDLKHQSLALARETFTVTYSFYLDEDQNPCKNVTTWKCTPRVTLTGVYNRIYY